MPGTEIELDPVEFVTVGTVGPKGRRQFHLQAGTSDQIVTLLIEKEQARALSDAVNELIESLAERYPERHVPEVNLARWDMTLRDPIEPLFRASQMGLGYDEDRDRVILIIQELVSTDQAVGIEPPEPDVVRIWATQTQIRALGQHAISVVEKGRADPKRNGHLIYYWL